MTRILTLFGATAGGWAGWYVGGVFGLGAAILLSLIGTALGSYYARRFADYYS